MKKIVACIFVLALIFIGLSACSSDNPDKSDPNRVFYSLVEEGKLKFQEEDDPAYLGSYTIRRSNLDQEWIETGEWSSSVELLFDSNKCIGFGYYVSGTFRASSGYHWVVQGRCLVLKKK